MNTYLKKAAATISIAALAVGMCTACGNKQTDKTEDGRTILKIGEWPAKEGARLTNYEGYKEEFEKQHPEFYIEPDTWAFDLSTFFPKAEAGLLPTVYSTNYTEIPLISNGGYAADLTEELKERGYLDKYREDVLKVVTNEEGRINAIPVTSYILGLAVNTDLMKQAGLVAEDGTPYQPTDWYDLAETAKKIQDATGVCGMAFPTANHAGGWMFMPIAWSFGVDFMEQDSDGKWQATFNTPECVEALQYIKDLKWKYGVLPANSLIDLEEYRKIFGSGNAGITIQAGDVASYVVKYGIKPDQFGMVALPSGPKKHVTLMGGTIFSVNNNATPEQIDGAVTWIEYVRSHKPDLDEADKKLMEDDMLSGMAENPDKLIGIKSMSVWDIDAEVTQFKYGLIDKYCNTNPNGVKLYNDFVINTPCEIQAEEPVCAQDLYGVLDNCIQEVLENENADCAKLIETACNDFQKNFLDTFAVN